MSDSLPPVNQFKKIEDFQEGCILLIDKKYGFTSFSVVGKLRAIIRKHLGVKKIKVGHAGTLDPLATGLLVLCTGKMTKKIQGLIDDNKEYTGTICLGKTTPSYDLETEPIGEADLSSINLAKLEENAKKFLGVIDQKPPVFSAKKIDGVRAYELARKGEDVVMKSNRVEILAFDILGYNEPEVSFRVSCSKGTYIRSLANDFGLELGCGAYLSSLRRTKSGEYDVENSMTVDDFEKAIELL